MCACQRLPRATPAWIPWPYGQHVAAAPHARSRRSRPRPPRPSALVVMGTTHTLLLNAVVVIYMNTHRPAKYLVVECMTASTPCESGCCSHTTTQHKQRFSAAGKLCAMVGGEQTLRNTTAHSHKQCPAPRHLQRGRGKGGIHHCVCPGHWSCQLRERRHVDHFTPRIFGRLEPHQIARYDACLQ